MEFLLYWNIKKKAFYIQALKLTGIVWWMMCCTVGGPAPAAAPVAGRRTVLELDRTAAAAGPAGDDNQLKYSLEKKAFPHLYDPIFAFFVKFN